MLGDRYSRAFYEVFCMALIAVWLPSKLLAYFIPFACILWFIFRANSGKTLLRLCFVLFLYFLLVCFYVFYYDSVYEKFIVQNSILSVLTYGSFFFFLFLPPGASYGDEDRFKYHRIIRFFIIIESLIGILQVFIFVAINGGSFDSATGDIAQGTLNPLSFLHPEDAGFSNQMYATNLLLLLLFYTPYSISKKSEIWVSVLGLVAVVFASVVHLFLAFLFALVLVVFYFKPFLLRLSRTRLLIALCLVFAMALAAVVQPKNFGLFSFYLDKITSNKSPKMSVTVNSLSALPQDFRWIYYIGLGPGQYSSRAGLIGTGKYFGRFNYPKKVPLIREGSSKAFKKYVYPAWEDVATNPRKYGNSTMSRPFYSILSLVIEFGYIAFALMLFLAFRMIKRMKKFYVSSDAARESMRSFYALACAVFILFLFIISFFENYLEVTQAIFPGLLMFRYFYFKVKLSEFK